MKVYWIKKPWPVSSFRGFTTLNVYDNGRSNRDDVEYSDAHFTKYGVVHVAAIPHNDNCFSKYKKEELKYYTHYSMVHNGKLWRAYSWGGAFDQRSIAFRVNKFARDVMRLTQGENNSQPVSPSKDAELEIERLKESLRGMVDLVLSLVETALPRVGIVWSSPSDYPLALRVALKLIGGNKDSMTS